MQAILAAKNQVKIIPTLPHRNSAIALSFFRQCDNSKRAAQVRREHPTQMTHSLSQTDRGRPCRTVEHSASGLAPGGHSPDLRRHPSCAHVHTAHEMGMSARFSGEAKQRKWSGGQHGE